MKDRHLKISVAVITLLFPLNSLYYFIKNIFTVGIGIFNYQIILSFIPMLIGMIGIIIFITSEFKKSGLFRIYLCYTIILIPIAFWEYYKIFFRSQEEGSNRFSPATYQTYIYFVIFLFNMTAAIVGLKLLTKERIIKLNYFNISDESIIQFAPTNGGLRLANRFIDLLLILALMYRFVEVLNIYEFDFQIPPQILIILEFIGIIYYYSVLEVIFKTSAGKCATNTLIVNKNAETASIGQLFGRTFCRLIPFDAFSYLGSSARGWHDTLTDTYVVDSVHYTEGGNKTSL
jgi:uncharacterized RDD family membrane protein YckC